ncbi:hypothetical protein PanWU01x14_099700, partial [Parasponia andersonii]
MDDNHHLMRILACYERASGPCVSMEKLAITFSLNVREEKNDAAIRIMGLDKVKSYDT